MSLQATILHLQRLSTEDGPGLRTTVFFKGCPLHCEWCHNPESISMLPQVQWLEYRCIGCRTCLKLCSEGGLRLNGNGMHINRELCNGCGICAAECPTLAMELLGTRVGVDELYSELIKDRSFFEKSLDGGVTLSGGEPMLQAEFTAALLQKLKEAGVHTAVDTCGLCSPSALDKVLPYTDLILYDLKVIDSDLHMRLTHQPNALILSNLHHIMRHTPGLRLWIRTPLIPGATAAPENIKAIAEFLSQTLPGAVERWELLAFNNLARDKYRRLGLDWKYAAASLMMRRELDTLEEVAKSNYTGTALVSLTGAARVAEN